MSGSAKRPDAAWLVTGLLKRDRYGRDAYDRRRPIGQTVVTEVLEQAGATLDYCSPATAHRYPVVLVSLTSEHDLLAFYRAVALRPEWQPGRRFRVIAGGYGMQNPYPARDYIDYAYFGRAEADVAAVLADAAAQRPTRSPAVMHLPEPHAVTMRQADRLYHGEAYRETFQGCPLACRFCQYTHVRPHRGADHAYSRSTGTRGAYVQTSGHQGVNVHQHFSIEITLPQMLDWPHARYYTSLTVGLDGASERLRWLFGKRIANEELTRAFTQHFREAAETGVDHMFVKLYDIAGLPTETPADREELTAALAAVEVPPGVWFGINVHSTPFRASAWTPMAWEAFSFEDWHARLARRRIATYREDDPAKPCFARYTSFIEGPGSQLLSTLATRHDGSPEADAAWRALAFSRRLRRTPSGSRAALVRATWPALADRLFGRLDLDVRLPTEWIEAPTDWARLRRQAARMREDYARGDDRWRRARSIMGAALDQAA